MLSKQEVRSERSVRTKQLRKHSSHQNRIWVRIHETDAEANCRDFDRTLAISKGIGREGTLTNLCWCKVGDYATRMSWSLGIVPLVNVLCNNMSPGYKYHWSCVIRRLLPWWRLRLKGFKTIVIKSQEVNVVKTLDIRIAFNLFTVISVVITEAKRKEDPWKWNCGIWEMDCRGIFKQLNLSWSRPILKGRACHY